MKRRIDGEMGGGGGETYRMENKFQAKHPQKVKFLPGNHVTDLKCVVDGQLKLKTEFKNRIPREPRISFYNKG